MKSKALILGTGGYLRRWEEALKAEYEVIAYVDNYRWGQTYNDGKAIVKPSQIKEYEGMYSVLVIMLEKVALNMSVAKQLLLDRHIEADKIRIGLSRYKFQDEFQIAVMDDGKWEIQFADASILVSSEMEFWDLYSMYYEDTYYYKLNNSKKDVVIDIGMNIGDSAIYYLNKSDTKKVYGFEPFEQTYLLAEENLERNHFKKEQYEIFQYGLSDHDERKKIFYHPEISIMLSTNNKYSMLEREEYERTHGCELEYKETEIEVRRASDMIGRIMEEHSDDNIVLKIDCEGEEYAILSDLDAEGLLNKVKYITVEWHYGEKEKIEEHLDRNGFSYCGRKIRENLGQIYAWR